MYKFLYYKYIICIYSLVYNFNIPTTNKFNALFEVNVHSYADNNV